jgi:cold shock CspA family protein
MSTPEEFLQFLYNLNVIAFIERTEDAAAYEDSSEEKKFTRWCFRERGPANISPEVRREVEYEMHYGLANTLNTDRRLRRPPADIRERAHQQEREKDSVQRGRLKWYDAKRGFGFIEQSGLPIGIYLPKRELPNEATNVRPGQELEYRLEKDRHGRLVAMAVRWKKS